jgi:hypothetical protein
VLYATILLFTKEHNMRSKLVVYTIAAGALFFAFGVAVGQRTSASRLARFHRPANLTWMDDILADENLALVRDSIPIEDLTIPFVRYNAIEDRLQATVYIPEALEKASLETVKKKILERYYWTYSESSERIGADLSEDDFVLKVFRFTHHELFAECAHGKIVFH